MSSGRKAGVGLLVTVLVLGGLLVLADRGAASAAEDKISERVAQTAAERKISMSGEPEVTVHGFPFLTQVIGGEYQAVDITMLDVKVNGVALASLDVTATEVKADAGALMDGTGDVHAGAVSGSANVSFAQVQELVGLKGAKASGEDGKLMIRVPVEAGPVKGTAIATADVVVAGNGLRIKVEDVTLAEGDLPDALRSSLASSLSRKIAVPELPYGLKLKGAAVTDTGVAATAAGADVSLVS